MKNIKAPKARRLPSGAWNVQVMINGVSRSFTGVNREQVEQDALRYKLAGKPLESQQTLRSAVQRFIDQREPVLSPSTIARYRQFARNDFLDLQRLRMDVITQKDCQSAINDFSRTHSPKTTINTWAFFHAVLKANGRSFTVTLPQNNSPEHPFLQPEQVIQFLRAIEGEAMEIPILLGLHGLRRSELMDVTWADVDLERKTIRVQGSAVRDSDGHFIHKKTNKAAASRRIVPIVIPRLFDLLERSERTGVYVCSCNPNSPYDAVNRVCDRLGFPRVGMHGLRHSYASLLFHLGANSKAVKALGGWEDDATVRRIYTHLADSDLTHAIDQIRAFFE